VDFDLRRTWETRLITYGVLPIPVQQDMLPSSIDTYGKRVRRRKDTIDIQYFLNKKKDEFHRLTYNLTFIGARSMLSAWLKEHAKLIVGKLSMR
jgi:hypothetical protein